MNNNWGRAWTAEEAETARTMRVAGHSYYEIGQRLSRQPGSIKSYLLRHHIVIPTAVRHRNMLKASVRRESNKQERYNVSAIVGQVCNVVVPDFVLADRDRRLNEYRSPAQILMGEPPPSQSALARTPARGPIERRESVIGWPSLI